ncbi:DUF2141 domain-containing protein [Christiangramia forsetii]|uniref:DUF2141 domain-containing protein n=2 Tax=Christiangramia forsetii TaxID=411153 RepID=A0M027_CHRFK|nr:DUF2141 domain-containing protein [Christiangramia forsetii]GGG45982.1 hypothetical protein GCM10011532_32370 [Christiangramia forsetii]CAL65972.1 conserved hypothetical protein, secreted [Christiangramia forsetii KT0803]
MKTIAVLVAMLLGSLMFGQTDNPGSITVSVPNISSDQGEILFALYSEDTFLKRKPNFAGKSLVENGQASVKFENVPVGTYAIIVLHDKNSNGKMDFDTAGIPEENYGTSGNSMIYGPPSWGDSKFDFDGSEKSIEIRF